MAFESYPSRLACRCCGGKAAASDLDCGSVPILRTSQGIAGDGAHYISLVLEALMADPAVWSSTVLLIDYDENDGLFDHVVPPMPPPSSVAGHEGMVSADLRETLGDEFIDFGQHSKHLQPLVPGADMGGLQPIGLGPRVPMLVVSPWSTGGWVCSEVFDHTSVLRFLERRFGVAEPNISPWRRSICGDLTFPTFDFSGAVQDRTLVLPRGNSVHSRNEQYSIPLEQKMPDQEPGTRPARALPYVLQTECRSEADRVHIDLINQGSAGAAFYVYDHLRLQRPPRRYAVSAGQGVSDFWPGTEDEQYDLAVYGPNGYVVQQSGRFSVSEPQVKVACKTSPKILQVTILNPSAEVLNASVAEAYTTFASSVFSLESCRKDG